MKKPNRKNCFIEPLVLDQIDYILKSWLKEDISIIKARSDVIALAIHPHYLAVRIKNGDMLNDDHLLGACPGLKGGDE